MLLLVSPSFVDVGISENKMLLFTVVQPPRELSLTVEVGRTRLCSLQLPASFSPRPQVLQSAGRRRSCNGTQLDIA